MVFCLYPYWVDVYVRLKDIYLIKCSLQYIYIPGTLSVVEILGVIHFLRHLLCLLVCN